MDTNKEKNQEQEFKEKVIDMADTIAIRNFGKKSARQFREDTVKDINTTPEDVMDQNPDMSENQAKTFARTINEDGMRAASSFTQALTLKILYQELQTPYYLSQFDFVNNFDDIVMEAGNTKEWVFKPDTGMSVYNINERVATNIITPVAYASTASMYTIGNSGTKQLTENAYQFRKLTTILRNEWLPFFISGKLDEFISQIVKSMRTTYNYFKAHTILQRLYCESMLAINGATNAQNQCEGAITLVRGTQRELFSCLFAEIMPILMKMQLGEPIYPYKNGMNDAIITSKPDDIIMLVPEEFKTALVSMWSTLPQAQLMELNQLINPNNIIALGSQLVIPGAKNLAINGTGTSMTIAKTTNTGNESNSITKDANLKYIPTNSILIFDKRFIKHILQIDITSDQDWSANLATDIYLHVWGVSKMLPWLPIVVYNNPNLTNIPTGTNN